MVIRQDLLDDDGTISAMVNGYKFMILRTDALEEETQERRLLEK